VAHLRRPRVLIVDDEDASALLTSAILASEKGIEVVGRVRHGREALTMAASVNPDVILMDLEMPVMDGIEATRLLRASGSSARIILLGDEEQVAAAEAVGADGYVPKPQTLSALREAILGQRDADS